MIFTGCNNESIESLTVIQIKGNYILPKEGVSISDSREMIIEKLMEMGVKGDIDKVALIEEITIKEVWENAGIQLFSVNVDYAWFYGVAIMKDNEVLEVLHGMPTLGVFLADLNKDSIYEVYTNIASGSGIVSMEILGYDIASLEKLHLSKRGEQDFSLFVQNNMLMAKVTTYPNVDKLEKTGRVMMRSIDNKKELYIQ